jgi:hypothetical protein
MTAVGCAVFVYVMLWVSDVHEVEPGLRPLATIALLLSIGVLTKPAVAISCLLLSLVTFIGGRRRFGGLVSYCLLLFTPAALCLLMLLTLNMLAPGTLHGAIPNITILHISEGHCSRPLDFSVLSSESTVLCFALAVLLARLVGRKSNILDFGFFVILVFLTTAGMAQWMPQALSTTEIRMIVYAASACLLALAPPQKALPRVMVLAGLSLPFLY